MSAKTYARFRLLCVILFLTGVFSAAIAFTVHKTDTKKRHAKGFTIVTKETNAPTNGGAPSEVGYAITVRYHRSDGTWKQIRTYHAANGQVLKRDVGFGIPGTGVFRLDRERRALEFLSSMPPKEETSYVQITNGHDDPHFVREDVVQGYATYVLRFPETDGGYTELYYASEFDNLPIRRVTVSPNAVSLTEPITIMFGEPDDVVFGSFPKWVVSFEHFKEKISAMEESGNHEAAQAMRQQIEDQLAKQIRDQ
jgi:hypothetical protein